MRLIPALLISGFFSIAWLNESRLISARWRNVHSALSIFWAFTISANILLKLAQIISGSLSDVLADFAIVRTYLLQVRSGQIFLFQLIFSLLLCAVIQLARTRAQFQMLLLATTLVLLPTALTGHSGGRAYHQLAVTSWAVHITAITIWFAVVLSLFFKLFSSRGSSEIEIRKVSRISLLCFIATVVSGVVNTSTRMPNFYALVHSEYGLILLIKVMVFILIGTLGGIYRLWLIPKLANTSNVFLKMISVEIFMMALSMMIGVILSQTPYPVVTIIAN